MIVDLVLSPGLVTIMTTILFLCSLILPSLAQLQLPELEQDCSLQCLEWCPVQQPVDPTTKYINETVTMTSTQVTTATKTSYVTVSKTDRHTSIKIDHSTIVHTEYSTDWTTLTTLYYTTACVHSNLTKRTVSTPESVIDESQLPTSQQADLILPSTTVVPDYGTDNYDYGELLPVSDVDQLISNAAQLDNLLAMANITIGLLSETTNNVTINTPVTENTMQFDWTKQPFLIVQFYPELTGISPYKLRLVLYIISYI